MYKEFLYEEPESENPYEMIERGISLYGDEHWKSMDDAEFEMHYGIPKREFLHNYSIEYSFYTREKVDFADDYSPLNMEEFMKEFKETAESHRNAPKIVQENGSGAPAGKNKAQKGQAPPAKNAPAPQSTSASPKAGKKRNKPNTPRKAKSSDSTTQETARKEFNAFKRDLIKSTRGSLGRTRINLMEKALKAAMDKAGIKWGTPEWAGLVRKFFPGADFAALSKAETPPAPTAEGTKTAPAKKEGTPTQDTVAQSPAEAKNDAEAEATAPAPTENRTGGMSEEKTGEEQQAPEEGKKEEGPQKGNTDQQKAAKEQIKQAVKAVKGPGGPGKSAKEEKTAAAGGKSSAPAPPAGGGGPLKINKPEDTGAKVSATQAKTDALEKAGDVLNRESESALKEKTEKIAKTSAGQRETKSAEEKRAEAEKAVEPPVEEAVSEANTGTIEVVDEAPEPEVDPAEQKQSVSNKMRDALPKTADEVKKLDKENPARKASQEMNQLVKEQTAGVKNTFNKIEDTPTPQPKSAEAPLPGPEPAVQQEAMNLSEGMLPPSDPGQSDFSEYPQASDDLVANELQNPELVKEFETSDATPMVEAREARDGIREEAEAAPQEVKDIEQAEQDNLDKTLGDEEKKATEEMANARKQGLEESTGTQQEKKTEFEQEKLRVSEHINKIYERTNDHIKTKLELLETQTMKAFEEGQKAAMETFDNTVDEELEEFFEERHSGIGGFFTAIGDWFSGTDDLPEVQEIFERNRVIYVETIDKLIEDLSANTEQVIEECKQILADAKEEIKEYVEGLDGKLKEFGEQCQDDIDQKLKKLSEDIEQKEKEMADKLAEEREKAIEAVDKRIEERKESMKSGLAKLGSMLLDLAIKFFTFTLTSLGMNPDEIMAMINKGVETLTLIVTDPKQFFSNLGGAVKQGLGQFQANFMKHMIGGMIEWLTGAMGGTVEIPTEFSFKGIFKMGMSILGLTWPSIRMKLVKHLGETIVTAAEKGFEIVTVLITEGPMGLWEWIKQEAATIKDTIIDSIKDWALTAIVKSAVTQLALMCNPVGAIVRAIIAIYDLVMWLVDNIQRIISFVNSVVDSVAAIAAGQISGAANYIESSIARTIPMILSGLAQFLKLNGIAKKIQQAIEKVRKPIDNAIDKGIGFVVEKVKGWFGGNKKKTGKGDAKKIKDENKKDKAEELDPKDKAKHKQIADKIENDLKKPKKKEKEDFKAFHKRMQQKGESLEDKYQSQLKKGINLDVKFKSVKEDEKDGDMDVRVTIKPNNTENNFSLEANSDNLEKLNTIAHPFAIEGMNHKLLFVPKGESFTLEMQSKQDELDDKKKSIITQLDQYINSADIPDEVKVLFKGIRAELEKNITEINSKTKAQIEEEVGKKKLKKTKGGTNRIKQDKIKAILNTAAHGIKQICSKYNIKDISPLGIEKAEIEKLQRILKEKQQEVETAFKLYKSELQSAIPPGSSVKYRGSLATGKKGPHKTVDGAVKFFDPNDFDCDTFIEVSSDVWYNEIAKDVPLALSKEKLHIDLLSAWSGYSKIVSVMKKIENLLSEISGYSIGDEEINLVVQTREKSQNQQQSGIEYPKGSLEKAGYPEHEKGLPNTTRINEDTGLPEEKIVLPEIHNTII